MIAVVSSFSEISSKLILKLDNRQSKLCGLDKISFCWEYKLELWQYFLFINMNGGLTGRLSSSPNASSLWSSSSINNTAWIICHCKIHCKHSTWPAWKCKNRLLGRLATLSCYYIIIMAITNQFDLIHSKSKISIILFYFTDPTRNKFHFLSVCLSSLFTPSMVQFQNIWSYEGTLKLK